jgi:Holliday junction resolvasome RuvABC endonuclease subunit
MDVPEDCLRLVSRIPKNNMCNSQETPKDVKTMILGIGTADQSEFKAGIVNAIFRTMKLVFERRETDLTDEDAFALYRLADLGERFSDGQASA